MFSGSIVALVTPFDDRDRLDEKKLRELVEIQITQGTGGIVPCGTTGESPTLSYEEHYRVIEVVIEAAARRVPVIAGSGSNSTSETLALTEHAKAMGADAALIITPYYNKPTQEGLYQHYRKVAESVDIPILIYNVPARTGVSIEPETVLRLARIPNIVGVKVASGNLDQVSRMLAGAPNLDILSGDDSLTVPMMAIGGKGVISVVANIAPGKVAAMTRAALDGDWTMARKLHYELFGLCRAMFLETNPIPVKTALRLMNQLNGRLRLPLSLMQPAAEQQLAAALREAGLIQ